MVYLGINNIVTKYAEATMIKTLTKHGNSAALVIERPILDLLGATADTAFEVVTDGYSNKRRESRRCIRYLRIK